MSIADKMVALLEERGYPATVLHGENNFWMITYSDPKAPGIEHCITPTSLVADQWWLSDLESSSDSYSAFLREVDRRMIVEVGMVTGDTDHNWRDEYDSEVSAEDAFEEWKIHTEDGTRSSGNC